MPRYKATADGNLIDTKNEITLHIKDVKIAKRGRLDVLNLTLDSGAKAQIVRWNVDETDHNFGGGKEEKKGPARARSLDRPVASVISDGIYLSRKELQDLYTAGKALVDLTLPKLLQ